MFEQNPNTYFAAANTTNGFQSYFPEIFDPERLEKIFILKGGPGTGKSSFMRIISKLAEEKGHKTEEYLCSSDPKSLDGLIIRDLKLAILDGTSPHTTDPTYPGIVESIINTGAFWDSEKLCRNKSQIISLIQDKKRYFKRAYHFLKAYGEIEAEILKIGEKGLLHEKMEQNIKRVFRRFSPSQGKDSSEEIRITSAINAHGFKTLNTFSQNCKNVFILEDCLFTSTAYLQVLYHLAKEGGLKIIKSFSCIFPGKIDGLWFPEESTCFVLGERDYGAEKPEKTYHYVNMQRFIDKELLQEHKQKLRFGKRCAEMLLGGAVDAFKEAENAHFELEKNYIAAMNFSELEKSVAAFSKLYLS